METTPCLICGSSRTAPVHTLADYLLDRKDARWTLVQCSQCGLVYQNPRPSLAEIGRHYPPDYGPYQSGGTQRASRLRRWAYDYGFQKRSRFVTQHKRGGHLLDLGCATGEFLAYLRQQGGWQVTGVELTPEVAQTARQRHGLEVVTGTLEAAAFPGQTFDVVTMWDVLEHLHDPAATLREIFRVLKDDGLLLIRVPNLASWDARLFGRYWAGLDAPRHLSVFTPTTLTQLLRQNGFHVREHHTTIGAYMVFVLSVQFWLNGHDVGAATKRRLLAVLNHPLTRLASAPFFYLPAKLRKGPLLVTIAVKDITKEPAKAPAKDRAQDSAQGSRG